jgi:hypothetical protein
MTELSIWRDHRTDTYEVVRWKDGQPLVLQTGIRTRDKAEVALTIWQQRERDRERDAKATS